MGIRWPLLPPPPPDPSSSLPQTHKTILQKEKVLRNGLNVGDRWLSGFWCVSHTGQRAVIEGVLTAELQRHKRNPAPQFHYNTPDSFKDILAHLIDWIEASQLKIILSL